MPSMPLFMATSAPKPYRGAWGEPQIHELPGGTGEVVGPLGGQRGGRAPCSPLSPPAASLLWVLFQGVPAQWDVGKTNVVPHGHKALPEVTEPSLGTVPMRPMEPCPSTGPAGAPWMSLLLLAVLSVPSLPKSLPASYGDTEEPQEGTGLIQCGEYSNQVLPNGRCRIVATLPQGDEQRCPDMFRCTDEVSYWLHENEERKQQILELRELISELQEELRNHRHRIKVLELQVRGCPRQVPPPPTPAGSQPLAGRGCRG